MKRCPAHLCPRLTNERYCPTHMAEYEAKRGTPQQRGYDARHVALRKAWQARIDSGEIIHCARCGKRISQGSTWALDHDDDDRTRYIGPSHASCNNEAGGRAAHTQAATDPRG